MKRCAQATIGVLYTGDLGSQIARLLVDHGHVVVTTSEGRSDHTRQRAIESGATLLQSVADVVLKSDVLLSIVLPSAANEVAERCRTAVKPIRGQSDTARKCFVDMNSIHPDTVCQIGGNMQQAGFGFVDATIHGTASQLRERGALYLSGVEKEHIRDLFSPFVRVVDLGDYIGIASTMKLLMSGMSKGLAALFMEVSRIAQDHELLHPYLAEFTTFYPDIMTVLERLVTTYPRHAARRASELTALASLARSLTPGMVREAAIDVSRLAERYEPDVNVSMSLRDVIESAVRNDQVGFRQTENK